MECVGNVKYRLRSVTNEAYLSSHNARLPSNSDVRLRPPLRSPPSAYPYPPAVLCKYQFPQSRKMNSTWGCWSRLEWMFVTKLGEKFNALPRALIAMGKSHVKISPSYLLASAPSKSTLETFFTFKQFSLPFPVPSTDIHRPSAAM